MSQFSAVTGKKTLSDYIKIPGVYPAGRLDYNSEGLLVLTNNGKWQNQISCSEKCVKTYLVQVEGIIHSNACHALMKGVSIQNYIAKALDVRVLAKKPGFVWKRDPPIRIRKNQPTSWLEIDLNQGKNRQVRRMLAAVGNPVLRLIRTTVCSWSVYDIAVGNYHEVINFDGL